MNSKVNTNPDIVEVELKAFGERNSGKSTILAICRDALVARGYVISKLPEHKQKEGIVVSRRRKVGTRRNAIMNMDELAKERITESRWQLGCTHGRMRYPKQQQHELMDHPWNQSYLNGYHWGSRQKYLEENRNEN